jgi:hypothetical protein
MTSLLADSINQAIYLCNWSDSSMMHQMTAIVPPPINTRDNFTSQRKGISVYVASYISDSPAVPPRAAKNFVLQVARFYRFTFFVDTNDIISVMLFLYYAALLYFALLSSAETSAPVVVESTSYIHKIQPKTQKGRIYGISHSSIVSHAYSLSSFSKLTVFYRTERGRLIESTALKRSTSVLSQETQGLPSLHLCHCCTPCPGISIKATRRWIWSRMSLLVRLPSAEKKEMILH